jgi:hypothetical protein
MIGPSLVGQGQLSARQQPSAVYLRPIAATQSRPCLPCRKPPARLAAHKLLATHLSLLLLQRRHVLPPSRATCAARQPKHRRAVRPSPSTDVLAPYMTSQTSIPSWTVGARAAPPPKAAARTTPPGPPSPVRGHRRAHRRSLACVRGRVRAYGERSGERAERARSAAGAARRGAPACVLDPRARARVAIGCGARREEVRASARGRAEA